MTGQSDGGRVLAVNVPVATDDGRVHLYRRGETPPPEVAARLGAHVWVGGDHVLRKVGARTPDQVRELAGAPAPTEVVPDPEPGEVVAGTPYVVGEPGPELAAPAEADPEEPPRTGPGASAEAWRDYARSLGQDVGAKAPRDAVIAQLAEAGLIEP